MLIATGKLQTRKMVSFQKGHSSNPITAILAIAAIRISVAWAYNQ
jgi:hypothetical protein